MVLAFQEISALCAGASVFLFQLLVTEVAVALIFIAQRLVDYRRWEVT